MSVATTPDIDSAAGNARHPRRSGGALRRMVARPKACVAVILVVLVVLIAAGAPLIAPQDPLRQFAGHELVGPSWRFLLGTDELGRDLLSRLVYGTRVSLYVSFLAAAIGTVGGGVTGLVAGYWGGFVDSLIMRVWDGALAIPPIVIGIILAAFVGPSSTNAAVALGVAVMPGFARLVRSITLQERGKDYVAAARLCGCRGARIIVRHILPNAGGPLAVQMCLTMGVAVLVEAGLSFLGLGAQPPAPSWGGMVATARNYSDLNIWYLICPGAAITALVLMLNLLGDALRDAFDPRGHISGSRG